MKRFGFGLLYGVVGYLITAAVGYFLILQLSSNNHDRGLEAAMTSIFVCGPIDGVLAFVTGFIRVSADKP